MPGLMGAVLRPLMLPAHQCPGMPSGELYGSFWWELRWLEYNEKGRQGRPSSRHFNGDSIGIGLVKKISRLCHCTDVELKSFYVLHLVKCLCTCLSTPLPPDGQTGKSFVYTEAWNLAAWSSDPSPVSFISFFSIMALLDV